MIALLLALAYAGELPDGSDGAPLAVDLAEAQRRAMDRAVGVELAQAAADAARGEASAWTGRALPALSLFSQLGVGAGFTPFGFERPIPWQVGLGARGAWTVIDPAGWAAATSARRTARGRDAMVAWSQAQARREAAVVYAQAWVAQRAAELLAKAAEDASTAEEAIRNQVEAGVRPAVEAARARADAMDLAAQAASSTGEARAACARLQALLDAGLSGRCELAPPTAARPLDGPDRHPALIAAEEALGAAVSAGDQARFNYLPRLSADGTLAEYIVAERGTGLGWSANLNVDIPLTIATTGPGDLAVARAEKRRAQAELDGQARDLGAAHLAALAREQAARTTLGARRSGLDAAREAFERTDARYQQGLEGITSWLDANRVRIQAEVALVIAEADLVAAVAEVEGVRGVR